MVRGEEGIPVRTVLKYATRFAKSIGIATLHTHVLDETDREAMVNFADSSGYGERKSEGSVWRTLRLVKMADGSSSGGYYYEMTENGIDIITAPMI